MRVALRAAVVATPVYLAACAVPDGGLFRAARFRDLHIYQGYAEKLLDGALPYRDVFVEYPPGAFAAFLPPSALRRQPLQRAFKTLMALCGVATIVLVALVLAELGASRAAASTLSVGLLALSPVALGPISLNTYDAVAGAADRARPLALPAGARRPRLRGAWSRDHGQGLPARAPAARVHLRVASGRPAQRGDRAAGAARRSQRPWSRPFAAYAPHGVFESFRSQAERGLQVESLGASVLLLLDRLGLYDAQVVRTTGVAGRNLAGGSADAVAVVSLVLEALAVVTVWALYARVRDARAHLPLAFAAAVAGFIAFTKVFSPQYLAWLVPLVVLVGGTAGVAAVALTAVALVLAQVWFFHYHALFRIDWPIWLLLARDLVLVALYAVLAGALTRWKIRIPSRSKTSRHSGLRRNQESWTAVGKGASRSA